MGKTVQRLSRKTRALAEIDIRIHDLILGYLTQEDVSSNDALGYLRAAYVQGYTDCLKDGEQKGQWIKDLGYGVTGVDL